MSKDNIIEIEVGKEVIFEEHLDILLDELIELFNTKKRMGATHVDVYIYKDKKLNLSFNRGR